MCIEVVLTKADLIVANEFSEIGENHRAYTIDKNKKIIEEIGRDNIASKIVEILPRRT